MAAKLQVVKLAPYGTTFPIGFTAGSISVMCDAGSLALSPPYPLDIPAALCSLMLFLEPGVIAGSRLFLDQTARALMGTQGQWDIRTYVACAINALQTVGLAPESS